MKVKRENILCRRNNRHNVIGPVGGTASEEAWESGLSPVCTASVPTEIQRIWSLGHLGKRKSPSLSQNH